MTTPLALHPGFVLLVAAGCALVAYRHLPPADMPLRYAWRGLVVATVYLAAAVFAAVFACLLLDPSARVQAQPIAVQIVCESATDDQTLTEKAQGEKDGGYVVAVYGTCHVQPVLAPGEVLDLRTVQPAIVTVLD